MSRFDNPHVVSVVDIQEGYPSFQDLPTPTVLLTAETITGF